MPAFRKLSQAMPLIRELGRVGEEHGRSVAQVALNWLARQAAVLPIPGAKNGQQAADNARAIDFELGVEQVEKLDELSQPWIR
jgi:aryl-alcohol dehydrogenase-like predicted oxidoreductase